MTRRSLAAAVFLIAATLSACTLGLAARGWGGWSGLLGHPARGAACLLLVLMAASSLLTDFNFSQGKREDRRNDWIFGPVIAIGLLLAWLPAYCDRRDLGTIDGDATRYLGLALFAIGGLLRVGPMLAMGPLFSARVAIQEGHRLVTTGYYRLVRHPSYLGILLAAAGWSLVFRSGYGLIVALPLAPLLDSRITAEEALLEAEFGEEFAAYRRRTRRLIPFIY